MEACAPHTTLCTTAWHPVEDGGETHGGRQAGNTMNVVSNLILVALLALANKSHLENTVETQMHFDEDGWSVEPSGSQSMTKRSPVPHLLKDKN